MQQSQNVYSNYTHAPLHGGALDVLAVNQQPASYFDTTNVVQYDKSKYVYTGTSAPPLACEGYSISGPKPASNQLDEYLEAALNCINLNNEAALFILHPGPVTFYDLYFSGYYDFEPIDVVCNGKRSDISTYLYHEDEVLWENTDREYRIFNHIFSELDSMFKSVAAIVTSRRVDLYIQSVDETNRNILIKSRDKLLTSIPKTRSKLTVDVLAKYVQQIAINLDGSKRVLNEYNNNKLISMDNKLVFDIPNFVIRNRTKEDYLTYALDCNCKQDNPHDAWLDTFLATIMTEDHLPPADRVRTSFLQELLGYSLLGTNPESLFVFFTGGTSNGKSTLTKLLKRVLGYGKCPLFGTLSKDALMHRKAGSATSELASLKGRLLAFIEECNATDKPDISLIKRITGGDDVHYRELYKNSSSFKCQALIVWCSNTLPQIEIDPAMDRRLLIFNFNTKFTDTPDPNNMLERKLVRGIEEWFEKQEIRDAFFSWMVKGYARYRERGSLDIPDEVLQKSNDIKADVDLYKRFVEDHCETLKDNSKSSEEFSSSCGEIHRHFNNIHSQYGIKVMPNTLKQHLEALGYPEKRNKKRYYHGLRVRVLDPWGCAKLSEPKQSTSHNFVQN